MEFSNLHDPIRKALQHVTVPRVSDTVEPMAMDGNITKCHSNLVTRQLVRANFHGIASFIGHERLFSIMNHHNSFIHSYHQYQASATILNAIMYYQWRRQFINLRSHWSLPRSPRGPGSDSWITDWSKIVFAHAARGTAGAGRRPRNSAGDATNGGFTGWKKQGQLPVMVDL